VTGLGWIDVLLIKDGDAVRLLAGHFTISAQARSPLQIPILSGKLAAVLAQLGFAPRSHNGRSAAAILEQTPRDELFALSEDELAARVRTILDLHEKPGVDALLRRDPLSGLVTVQMLLPTARLTPSLGEQIAALAAQLLSGRLLAAPQPMARGAVTCLHLTFDAVAARLDLADLRPALVQAVGEILQSWSDRLRKQLLADRPGEGAALWARYETCFPAAYRDRYSAGQAVRDLRGIAGALINRIAILLDDGAEPGVRVFHRGGAVQLYTLLPLLDGMGVRVVREFSVRLTPRGDEPVWLHDIGIELPAGTGLTDREAAFAELFRQLWAGQVESDGFNRLFLSAQLDSAQIVLLRAYAKYLRQTSPAIGVRAIERALIQYPAIARLLVRLFAIRFDPDSGDDRAPMQGALTQVLERELAEVAGADDDRILRRLANLIDATLRTNAYQRQGDGQAKRYLSFKFDCARIDDLPAPRPMAEIFVYSPDMEGIHLRGARVARGGLRWSDRREDFRTEILGLMKAQMVKNAVIVPMGSKGGFVVKMPASDPKQRREQGIACYRTLIRGMLDLTDTLVAGTVKPPADVVRYDGDDPYLVVAADKGTATFSDIANAIAEEYGFWLGDAFASGGSQGYDHKRMGITARGAWESVKRHFREMGRDIQTEPATIVGVGDMSGDVFGNGMLQSRQLRLVAAFNHDHIFIDPTPDPAVSFAERQRLFDLPGSSWSDYDPAALSPGGAIFRRDAKHVRLSAEAVAALDLPSFTLTPDALIQALLLAPVDLLWFGGIGTYIRAAQESESDVGDRTNDAVRVSADRLRCAVIGEGANLALTQPARITFALNGGRINTDAVDNSAGVDCSDHEVNIKILLAEAVSAGRLSLAARNERLRAMTDDVAQLVLADNIRQTGILSQLSRPAGGWGEGQIALMRRLEQEGRLDRALEHLPSDNALADRLSRGQGLTRPEHAVLLAYGKNWLADVVRSANPIADADLHGDLIRYFPTALQQDPLVDIAGHALANDILATVLANEIANRLGPAQVFALIHEDGRAPLAVIRAYVALRDIFNLPAYWQAVDALDGQVPAEMQTDLLDHSARLLDRALPRLLDIEGEDFALAALIADGRAILPALRRALQTESGVFVAEARSRANLPAALADQAEELAYVVAVLEIRAIQADQPYAELADICRIYLRSDVRFGFDWLRRRASGLKGGSGWQRRAVAGLLEDLDHHHRRLTRRVLGEAGRRRAGQDPLDHWVLARAQQMRRFDQVMDEMRAVEAVDVSMLAVTNRMLAALTA